MTPGQYVPLSVAYYEDDRVLDAGHVAETLYTRSLALVGRLMTDGFLSTRQIERLVVGLPTPPDPVAELVRVGLYRPDFSDPYRPGYRIRSWLDWNLPAEEIRARIEERRAKDRERQRRSREKSKGAPTGVTGGVTRDGDVTSADVTDLYSTTAVEIQQQQQTPPPPPPFRSPDEQAAVEALIDAIAAAGLSVSWKLTAAETHDVVDAIRRSGVGALVAYAKRRHRPDAPAFSAKAWLDGWRTLPALRLVEDAKAAPCGAHPELGPVHVCSACASEAKAGER